MVDTDLLGAKLAELAHRVSRVDEKRPVDAATLASDADALELVSFNLMLAVQLCSDIASHLIADEGLAAATSLRQGFERLVDHGVLSPETGTALARAVGLRNVVAHGYQAVDPQLVWVAATTGLGDLRRFAFEVASWATPPRP